MDGTLVSTDAANNNAYAYAVKRVTNSDIGKNLIGRITRGTIAKLYPSLTESESAEIAYWKKESYKEFVSSTIANEDLLEILFEYSKTSEIVLLTRSGEERAEITLKHHDIYDFFNRRIYVKSEQDKYRMAIDTLKVSPETIHVFENEDCEIQSALNAGIPRNHIYKIDF